MRRVVSRRDFLKLAGLSLGVMAFNPFERVPLFQPPYLQFPTGERLGRLCVYPDWNFIDIKSKPHAYSSTVRRIVDDEVIEWEREVIGTDSYSVDSVAYQGLSKTWVETPEGYIYEPHLQPVRNMPNTPMAAMPEGKAGFWAEVTVPYVELAHEGNVASPWLQDHIEYNFTSFPGTNFAKACRCGMSFRTSLRKAFVPEVK